MEQASADQKQFLLELCNMTGGQAENAASMYDVGLAIGLEKAAAGAMAEDLIVEGWLELRSLSGGVSITMDGLRMIDRETGENAAPILRLGTNLTLGEDDVLAVRELIDEVKEIGLAGKSSYQQIEELVMDIKTLEVQLLSPRPKTAIAREALRSLAAFLDESGKSSVADRISLMING